ncbi:hypothetical protein N5N14_004254 [Escherichia coli]|nr:hypothetical protein [Salmonella enterica]EJU9681399.1 hypothetical protein [Escherichia coli]EAO0603637.1 hypothetical protein [Salmonella enterica]EAQ0385864.1 hypothetical protein [Salmonella enterica]EAR7974730.1 hypothetical protein [Salmonella enterica]
MHYGYKNLLSNEEKDFYQEKFEKALEDLLEKKNKEIKEEFEKITNDFILEKIDEEDLGDRHNLFKKEYFALRGIFENVFNDRMNKNRW